MEPLPLPSQSFGFIVNMVPLTSMHHDIERLMDLENIRSPLQFEAEAQRRVETKLFPDGRQ